MKNSKVKLINSIKDYLDTFYLYIDSLDDLEGFKCNNGKFFSCVLLNFSPEIAQDSFFKFANSMLKSGLVVFHSWGTDCEHFHDLFDEEYCANFDRPENTEKNTVLTCWHANVSLKEGIGDSYWICPASSFLSEFRTILYINLAGKQFENEIISYLSDTRLLLDEKN